MLKKAKEILLISIVTFISFFFLSACSNKSASKQQMTRPKELQSWQMSNMNYIQLHKLSTGKSQKIALIDSGVTQNEKTVYSASLIGGSEFDENGHGTMMYSLIKGIPNELQGIAPDVSIISLKIMGAESSVTPEIIKQGIEQAKKEGATIINLSIGSTKNNPLIANEIKKCIDSGISIVASSGDYSSESMMFPASSEGVISVGAIDQKGQILSLTSGANHTVINATGGDVMTEGLDSKIFQSSGTSQATALISGYVALLKDVVARYHKVLSNEQIISNLEKINSGTENYLSILKKIK